MTNLEWLARNNRQFELGLAALVREHTKDYMPKMSEDVSVRWLLSKHCPYVMEREECGQHCLID